jgi:hypothetical protein
MTQMNPSMGYGSVLDPLENGHAISPALGLGESRLDVFASLKSISGAK